MEARIYVVRHGHTAMNTGGETSVDRIRGWVDVPLNAEGLKDAKTAAQELEGRGIERIVSSDLKRSRQTAAVIGKHLGVPVTNTRGLRPWHLGVLSGQPSKEAAPVIDHFARQTPNQAVPEGETFQQFTTRLLKTLTQIQRQAKARGETVAIVSHYRDLKAMMAGLGTGKSPEHLDLDTFARNDIKPVAILEMVPNGGHWTVKLVSRGLSDG